MINTTDFQEFEISLPGDWLRKDNGDIYSFTVDKMEVRDERLFRQLYIRHKAAQPRSVQYALTIEDDYFGILLNEEEFIVQQLVKRSDGSAMMEWEDKAGLSIVFEKK